MPPKKTKNTILSFEIFDNSYLFPLIAEGKNFNCAEQYFQYLKARHFGDKKAKDAILAAKDPKEQKRLG